jgi:hypothetical protein
MACLQPFDESHGLDRARAFPATLAYFCKTMPC